MPETKPPETVSPAPGETPPALEAVYPDACRFGAGNERRIGCKSYAALAAVLSAGGTADAAAVKRAVWGERAAADDPEAVDNRLGKLLCVLNKTLGRELGCGKRLMIDRGNVLLR